MNYFSFWVLVNLSAPFVWHLKWDPPKKLSYFFQSWKILRPANILPHVSKTKYNKNVFCFYCSRSSDNIHNLFSRASDGQLANIPSEYSTFKINLIVFDRWFGKSSSFKEWKNCQPVWNPTHVALIRIFALAHFSAQKYWIF